MMQKILRPLNIASFLQAQLFLLPVLLLFYQHNGLTVADFFLFQGIFSIASILFELPSGYLGDLFPKKKVLITSYSFFVARCLLWIFFSKYGYWILLIGEILFAAQKAFYSGVADAYIYEYLKSQGQEKSMNKRYGKLYAYISAGTALSSLFAAWLYHKISEWSMGQYGYDYGFVVLLCLELILNVSAIVLLMQLPDTFATQKRECKSLKEIYMNFFHVIKWSLSKYELRYHILLASFLWSGTTLFVWAFQPMMQSLLIPIALYGFIYFMNHLCRTFFSATTGNIMKHVSLFHVGMISYIWYCFGFIGSIFILKMQPLPLWFNLCYFLFICIGTGLQLVYGNAQISRLHSICPKEIRATVSSFNSMVGRLFCGGLLILMKFLINDFSFTVSLGICFGIFLLGIFPIINVFKISCQEVK